MAGFDLAIVAMRHLLYNCTYFDLNEQAEIQILNGLYSSMSFPSKWRSWFFFLSFAFLNISFPKSETRTGSSVRSWELHSIIIAFEEFKVCTGYLFILCIFTSSLFKLKLCTKKYENKIEAQTWGLGTLGALVWEPRMTEYLSIRRRPEFFNLRLRLRQLKIFT